MVYTDLKEKDALLRQQSEQLSTMEHMYTELVTQVGGAMTNTQYGTEPMLLRPWFPAAWSYCCRAPTPAYKQLRIILNLSEAL